MAGFNFSAEIRYQQIREIGQKLAGFAVNRSRKGNQFMEGLQSLVDALGRLMDTAQRNPVGAVVVLAMVLAICWAWHS